VTQHSPASLPQSTHPLHPTPVNSASGYVAHFVNDGSASKREGGGHLYLRDGEPLLGIGHQNFSNEVLALLRYSRRPWNVVIHLQDAIQNLQQFKACVLQSHP